MKNAALTLITGGSRSGKSRFAIQKIAPFPRKIFLATAVATDVEMEARIRRHREERSPDFITVEEPLYLAQAICKYASSADAILVDCLTFWLNNLFHYGVDAAGEIQSFLKLLEEKPTSLILVTNEITMGIIPPDPLTRRFVDEQGKLNQEAARLADEVIFMVAGIPQILNKESYVPSP